MARKKGRGVITKVEPAYYGCAEVMVLCSCKESKAYQIIRGLRKELMESNQLSPLCPEGRIPKNYLRERMMIE